MKQLMNFFVNDWVWINFKIWINLFKEIISTNINIIINFKYYKMYYIIQKVINFEKKERKALTKKPFVINEC